MSSGGAIYGSKNPCPLKEDYELFPINSYGVQKIAIEKLLYLYKYQYGLDYKVVRLSNPYGPHQKAYGIQGVITTFLHNMMRNENVVVWGDGSTVRDFIYIDDAIKAIINVASDNSENEIFNVGSGRGVSIQEVICAIINQVSTSSKVIYENERTVDVKENYLDTTRYKELFGEIETISLEEGIRKTFEFMKLEAMGND